MGWDIESSTWNRNVHFWGWMGWEWNRDLHLRGLVDGYIMERDRILRKKRMDERKEEFEETIRSDVKIELEKITGRR